MSRRNVRLNPIHLCLIVGVLVLTVWLYLSEELIISLAWTLSHKLLLGKVLKARVLLSLLRLLKAFSLISGLSLIVCGFLIMLVEICTRLLMRLPGALERILEKLSRYLSRHFLASVSVLLAIVVLALYGPSLSFNFFMDDFYGFQTFRSYGLKVFHPQSQVGWAHFSPVALLIFGLPIVISRCDPFWSHLMCLLLHFTNSLLIFYLCYHLTERKAVSVMAGLIFATFYLNFEVVFWAIVGAYFGGASFLSLAALLCFVKYLNGRTRYYYWTFVALYTLAQLTMEMAWAFLPIYALYEITYSPPSRRITGKVERIRWAGQFSAKYFVPVFLSLVTMGLKYSVGIPLTLSHGSEWSASGIANKIMGTLVYLVVSDNLVDLSLGGFCTLYRAELVYSSFGLALLSVVIAAKAPRNVKFFYFWGLFMFCVMVLSTNMISPRYLYLSVAGFSVFLSLSLHGVLNHFSRLVEPEVFSQWDGSQLDRKKVSNAAVALVGVLIVLLIVMKEATFIIDRRTEWRRASDIVTSVLRDVQKYYPEAPSDSVVYFVDIPSWLNTKQLDLVPVFGNGLRIALMMVYRTQFSREIRFLDTGSSPHPVTRPSERVSFEKLDRLSSMPGVEVVFFSSETGSVRKWLPNRHRKSAEGARGASDLGR